MTIFGYIGGGRWHELIEYFLELGQLPEWEIDPIHDGDKVISQCEGVNFIDVLIMM
jgi:hypothetical protein